MRDQVTPADATSDLQSNYDPAMETNAAPASTKDSTNYLSGPGPAIEFLH